MKILVTCGDGFIGGELIKALGNEHDVTNCDLRSGSDFIDADTDFDVVIHCAAVMGPEETAGCIRENIVKLDSYLSRLAQRNPICHFIFLSSFAVYGATNHYGMSKVMGEWLVKHYLKSYAIFRPTNVIGSGQERKVKPNCITHFEQDDPIVVYGGEQVRNFISIDYVVKEITKNVQSKEIGTFNLCSGKKVNIFNLACEMAAERGVSLVLESPITGDPLE